MPVTRALRTPSMAHVRHQLDLPAPYYTTLILLLEIPIDSAYNIGLLLPRQSLRLSRIGTKAVLVSLPALLALFYAEWRC